MKSIPFEDIDIHEIGNTIQIIGIIWGNATESFVTLFPTGNEEELQNLSILPMTLKNWEDFLRQTDLLETEIFSKDSTGKVVKAIVRKTQRSIDSFMQWNVFKRDYYTCRYCGKDGIPVTVDHVDLWENGGATIPENLITACKKCNKDRGRMEYGDWIDSETYEQRSKDLPEEVKLLNELRKIGLSNLTNKRVKHIRTR